jgi:protein-S-isoprenylcysteine O-methyltransferase Ste14
MKIDPSIYYAHAAFWGAFGLTRAIVSRRNPVKGVAVEAAPVSGEVQTAPFSRALLACHMLGFATLYGGIGSAVFSGRMPVWFPFQRVLGFLLIAAGAALAVWALLYFRSWRFRAKLEEGHQLASGGPFRWFRHPIYMGLNLLALGSAVWIPTPLVWTGFVLMAIGSDLRGRSEEKLLRHAFGNLYQDYCARTARFLPGIY